MKNILILLFIFTTFTIRISAVTVDNLSYTVDFTAGTAKLTGVPKDIKDLVVPKEIVATDFWHIDPVTAQVISIDLPTQTNVAFKETLETVKAPFVTSVKGLNNCVKLKSIDTPQATEIYSCSGCPELTFINYNSTAITRFGPFANCEKLFKGGLTLPKNVSSLLNWHFKNCTSLAWIDMSNCNISTIPTSCFQGSNIESVRFPKSLKTIGENAFADCHRLKHSVLILPESVEAIKDGAFLNCISLTAINLNNAVPYYSKYASDESEMQGIFNGCINLESVDFSPATTLITPLMFNGCVKLNKITLPDAVTKISANAFNGCKSLKGTEKKPFKLSANLTYIGVRAFSGCSSLEWVNYVKADNRVITIENYGFEDCIELKRFTVRKVIGVRPMIKGYNAKQSAENFSLELKSGAFSRCPNLQFIPEGANITSTNELYNIFGQNDLAQTLYVPGEHDINSDYIESLLLEGQEASQIKKVYFSPYFNNIASNACSEMQEITDVTFLASVEIEDDDEFETPVIEDYSFYNCNKIMNVESYWMAPPILKPAAFNSEIYQQANLLIPEGTDAMYLADDGWKKFSSLNTGKVENPSPNATESQSRKCYTIEGLPCSIDSKGLVIIIDSNGTHKKAINR